MLRMSRIFLVLVLLGLAAPTPAQTPPSKTETDQTDKTTPTPEEKKEWEAMLNETTRESLNPSYLPLLDAFSPFTKVGKEVRSKPYTSPLSDSVNFLKSPLIQEGTRLTRNWLTNFQGLDPNFQSPVLADLMQNLMGFFNLMRGIIPLELNWMAEDRVALAYRNHAVLLTNLEEGLRFMEAFQIGDWEKGHMASGWNHQRPILFAEAVKGFTPKECNRLLQLIERWESGNGTLEIGLGNTMKQELIRSLNMVQDDGSIYVGEDEKNNPEDTSDEMSAEKAMDKGSDKELSKIDDFLSSFFVAPKQPSLHPNAEALHKKQVLTSTILNDYEQVYRLIVDPFASPSKQRDKPEWIKQANVMSQIDSMDIEMNGLQKERLSLRLLAVHTVICKFRWEHDRLPRTLAELKLKTRIIDPITHKSFQYKVEGDSYLLTSAMPIKMDEDGNLKPQPGAFDLMAEPMPFIETLFEGDEEPKPETTK